MIDAQCITATIEVVFAVIALAIVGFHGANNLAAVVACVNDFVNFIEVAAGRHVAPIGVRLGQLLARQAEQSDAHYYSWELIFQAMIGDECCVTSNDVIDMTAQTTQVKRHEVQGCWRRFVTDPISDHIDDRANNCINVGVAKCAVVVL